MQAMPLQRKFRYAFSAVAMAAMLAGCSSDRLLGSSSPPPPPPVADGGAAPDATPDADTASSGGGRMIASSMADLVFGSFGSSTPVTASGSPGVECPGVDIRPGTSTLTIPPSGGDAGALTLRYQGTLGQMARACSVAGGIMKMKVGVEGRVILGPAGGPGKIDLPLRFAVVHEGPEPKTVVTKLYKVPVTIPEGQPSVPFRYIDEDIAFPMPNRTDLDFYVVYVGFDPLADKAPAVKKPAAKPTAKPRVR